jgi:hypothetical protein
MGLDNGGAASERCGRQSLHRKAQGDIFGGGQLFVARDETGYQDRESGIVDIRIAARRLSICRSPKRMSENVCRTMGGYSRRLSIGSSDAPSLSSFLALLVAFAVARCEWPDDCLPMSVPLFLEIKPVPPIAA